MKINQLIGLLLISNATLSFGQFGQHIRTGRPGQGIGPYSVGKNILQIQTGFEYGHYKTDPFYISGNTYTPSATVRFGITEKIEINTTWSYQHQIYQYALFSGKLSGINLAGIGTRINIIEEANYRPAIGMQLTLKLPIQSPDFNTDFIAPKVLFIANQKLSENFSLQANIGLNYNEITPQPRGIYVACLNYAINDKIGVFAEN